ncbi:hypothetical protein RKD18_003765 [Streptomyces phaeoluteigriseus]
MSEEVPEPPVVPSAEEPSEEPSAEPPSVDSPEPPEPSEPLCSNVSVSSSY